MVIRKWALVLFPLVLLGQPNNNTVTVTVSRPGNPQPDQAVFGITVYSGSDKTLDDVLAALTGSGITAANLVGISAPAIPSQTVPPRVQPGLQWNFTSAVPFSKLKETTASLTSLQAAVAQKNNGMFLTFALQNTQASPQAQACDLGGLVNDARAQAQKIAGPAGASAGAIVGIAGTIVQSSPVCLLTVKFALGAMFGQPGPNAMTVTASRTLSPARDQVLILLSVGSGLNAGLDDITAALQAAGITGSAFSGVTTQPIPPPIASPSPAPAPGLVWSFTLAVPLSKLAASLSQLSTAAQTFATRPGLFLNFFVGGLLPSSEPACPEADLLADARAYAQKLAAAAGVIAGGILSLTAGVDASVGLPVPVIRTGDFTSVSGFGLASFVLSAPVPACSRTVQFQLQ